MAVEGYCDHKKYREIESKYYIARSHIIAKENNAYAKAKDEYNVILSNVKSEYRHILSIIQGDYREAIEKMKDERDQEISKINYKNNPR